jgi:hypothetical protein
LAGYFGRGYYLIHGTCRLQFLVQFGVVSVTLSIIMAAPLGPMKRKNPFSDEVPLQLKFHVGEKEMADDSGMEKVYAHTKALLFKGANPHISDKTLQTIVGMNDAPINGSHYHSMPSSTRTTAPLSCLHCRGKDRIVNCIDCNQKICQNCLRPCFYCQNYYCHYCTILNYEDTQVKAICLNCLSNH